MMVELIQMSGLAAGTAVAGHARVVASDLARTRTEALYQRFELADPSGVQVVARRFGCGSPPPPAGCVVYVQGVVEEYRGQTTLKLHACREDPVVPAALFFPRVPHTRRATLADLDALVDGIEDAALRALVRACFGPAVRERFAVAPAGVRHHGAAVGGLLAHTVRVARTALALTELVPHVVDRDVVVSAALLHDLGKVDELVPDPGAGLTDPGRLLGHVLLGAVAVLRASTAAPGLPRDRVEAVLHAIVAAHGRVEYGALVPPATIEALVLHHADAAEATLDAALVAVERAGPGAVWTPYLPKFHGSLRVPTIAPGTVEVGERSAEPDP